MCAERYIINIYMLLKSIHSVKMFVGIGHVGVAQHLPPVVLAQPSIKKVVDRSPPNEIGQAKF